MKKYFYTTFVCMMFLLFNAVTALAQQRQITGVVADQQGITLPGVTVKLKGTTVNAVTNVKGEFKLDLTAGNNTLVFSFIGMQTLEIAAGPNQTKLQVTMQNASRDLNEVVVVGYGTTKKSDVTGSVGSIKGSDLNRTPSGSVDQLLQGKIPGVQVIAPSGQPGAGATIRVRGLGSRSGANALVVVDGIPLGDAGNIKQVNPDDIESIEVLKDASSASIYGSRGANGVILITTRRGKTGQARITLNALTTVSTLGNKLDVFHDPVDVATLNNESRLNGGEASQYVGQNIGGTYYPSVAELRGIDPSKKPWPYNTNWADLVYRNPVSQSYTLSADGGTETTKYSVSGNYYNEQGLAIKNGYEKYVGRVNLEQKLKRNVTLGVNIISTWAKNYGQGLSVDRNIIFPALNPDGTYFHIGSNDYGNPLQIANEVLNQSKTIDILSSAFISWDIIKGLNLRSRISNTYGNSIGDNYQPRDATGTGYQFQGFGVVDNYSANHMIVENFLTYDRDLGTKHHVNFVAGTSYENTTVRTSNIQGQGFVNDILKNENIAGATTYVVNNNATRTVLESYYGRFNYTFLNRYLFTFTGRTDGSSKFGANNKYAFFPSGAVAWKVNEEAFMKAIPQVSELKLRGSYGIVGNQGISPYQSLSLLGSYKYFTDGGFQTGYGPPFFNDGSNVNGKVFNGLGNNSLKWETTRQMDLGIDLGLFDQRFTITADYYYKHTTDLLRLNQIALSSGYSVIQINDGVIDNKGFELGANAQVLTGKLQWSLGGIFSLNRNKVLQIGGGNSVEAAGGDIEAIRAPLNYYINGQPALVFAGYHYGGIIQQTGGVSPVDGTVQRAGDIRYIAGGPLPVGQNGKYIIGNPNPDFTYSFNTSLKYAGFDLSAQVYGVKGNDVFNFSKFTPSAQLQRWTPDNPSTTYPSVNSTRVNYASDWYVEDGSFLRIQNVNLGYTFKPNTIKGISNLRIYFSGNNLYTFTKFNPSFDPEVQENGQFDGNYRKPRAFSLGLNVSF
ncbi:MULTISPECIES: TonB-dependent receptor [unclassified Mucilaginibacter]|uniref:SusC/RagA family TonB-linked outer membrane protein n=1 Tax=unclassified Mucilaginibacter TaxID=2617802 RepID=UPI002AC97E92|nr:MULTISPECIES: TonB-dependent receptor [unclassified Mucilaginibacter]MEB0248740.1 TonB-dependent receptor [Mucilaginibacter sp. 5B2]MEB0260086.1 TonB-dependent receptor [Mucilaginibacter sp. 10I4]MEB0279192.1 TonB-dependent receptor [Mucilaginibacter sp. 10B2]MEB0301976.1 TonB-dependent receptor [Mucilaginibacter sp. 5C4]WPX22371.1 TonB-dependent receptor [Mucilaginibacter sp. 5C4]